MTTDTTEFQTIFENERILCGRIQDDIFYSFIKKNAICTSKEMKIVFDAYNDLAVNGPLKIIAEMAPFSTVDKSAREFLQNHENIAICEAAVIHSLSQRLLINFYHAFKSHNHPSKVFKNRENALKWVNSNN